VNSIHGKLTPDERTAVRRWKLGHHAFHLYLVAMNSELRDAAGALSKQDWPVSADCFRRLALLYDSATASMRYASSFQPDIYRHLIRPSMAEPYLSPGFSGQLNPDHEQMLERLRALRRHMRPLLRRPDRPPSDLVAAWQRLVEAQRRNRASHMAICERFVAGGQSLLKEFWQEER
jgi:hypothetical protein